MYDNNEDEDFVPVGEHANAEHADLTEHVDLHNSESMLSMPDNTNAVALLQQVSTTVRQAINEERRRYFDLTKSALRVNTNKSGGVQFRTYKLTASMGAVMIAKEKENRGNLIVVVSEVGTNPAISIGSHPGIQYLGSDTIRCVGAILPTFRVIRTRKELWAVVAPNQVGVVTFDVQEEFD